METKLFSKARIELISAIVSLSVRALDCSEFQHDLEFCLPHVRKHAVVCLTKDIKKEVKGKFKAHAELQDKEKIDILTIGEALSKNYVP